MKIKIQSITWNFKSLNNLCHPYQTPCTFAEELKTDKHPNPVKCWVLPQCSIVVHLLLLLQPQTSHSVRRKSPLWLLLLLTIFILRIYWCWWWWWRQFDCIQFYFLLPLQQTSFSIPWPTTYIAFCCFRRLVIIHHYTTQDEGKHKLLLKSNKLRNNNRTNKYIEWI